LANVQSLHKENTLLLTDKKFDSCDDEIMLKDLYLVIIVVWGEERR